MKYQNYLYFKLPITVNPLEYGKLIEQINNKYIIQLNTTNILIINKIENSNFIKLFKKGELIFEFKDTKLTENIILRYILDQRFISKNSKLIKTEILVVNRYITIFDYNNPLYKETIAIKLKQFYKDN